ncbi:MAG: serine hydrolase [Gemmatimonadota bacterium]|nr:MAG: serine hydrolase [Gemmatimonadota bacterium]
MDTDPFVRLMNRLHATENHLIHSVLVVKDGTLVFEEYFDGADLNLFDEDMMTGCTLCFEEKHFTRDELHFTASVTKSITSQVFGIAVDRGYISGSDAKMVSFFPDYAHLRTPEKDQITVHQMLSMTTGLPFDERTYPISDSRNDAFQLFLSKDPLAFMLGRDVAQAPGRSYQYNSGTTVLLGEIIRRATEQSLPSFAEEHLFAPLGITTYQWADCFGAPNVSFASGGLYLRPRDMAKVGQLMLQGGVWNGHRLLSSDWVQRSVTMATAVTDGSGIDGYGYQWKLRRYSGLDAFYASGWGEQFLVVIPEENLVYVQTSGRYNGERIPVWHDAIIEGYVLPAIRDRVAAQDASVRAVVDAWPGLLDGGDVDGIMDILAADPVLIHPRLPGFVGRDSIRAFVEQVFRQQAAVGSSIQVETIQTAGNWAHVVARFETTWNPRNGASPFRESARYLWVLRRDASGVWKVKSFSFYPIN